MRSDAGGTVDEVDQSIPDEKQEQHSCLNPGNNLYGVVVYSAVGKSHATSTTTTQIGTPMHLLRVTCDILVISRHIETMDVEVFVWVLHKHYTNLPLMC